MQSLHPALQPLASPLRRASRRAPARACALPDATPPAAPSPPPPQPPQPEAGGGKVVAAGAALFGAALFLLSRSAVAPSFAALEAESVPFETARSNGRPSVLEFYADWCEVCRESLPSVVDVERQQSGKVNFVLLNVDNTKWAPEMSEFDVDGIPHFVFLDAQGVKQGEVIGKFPASLLSANAAALASAQPLPYAGRTVSAVISSASDGPRKELLASGGSASPRAHGW